MRFEKISIIVILSLVFTSGCSSEKTMVKQLKVKQEIDFKFNIPELLKMNINQVKENLGIPNSEFIPNDMQRSIDPDILSTVEYQKGTTIIQIDYSKIGKIQTIFISDNSEGITKEDIVKLGNLNILGSEYKIRVQEWLNPEYARKLKSAEIAGIEVTPY